MINWPSQSVLEENLLFNSSNKSSLYITISFILFDMFELYEYSDTRRYLVGSNNENRQTNTMI